MICVVCERLSIRCICKKCQEVFLRIYPTSRTEGRIKVYSFYRYEDISFLLKSKYYAIGSRVYKILAQKIAQYFFEKNGKQPCKIFSVGIDDVIKNGYSHTSIILHAFRKSFTPIYGELRARNSIQYAGKSLEFRKNNPKGLCYCSGARDLVVFDDIITTGTSMLEAHEVISANGGNFLYGITLCDARN